MKKLLIGLVVALMAALPAAPAAASAADHRYYGDTARQVAKQIGCKHFQNQRVPRELKPYVKSVGGCLKNSRGLAIFTFAKPKKQKTLEKYFAAGATRREFWASGKGAIIMGASADKPTAKLGARLLKGQVRHG